MTTSDNVSESKPQTGQWLKRKTLMVTWSFPPTLLGSAQIAAGLARQFDRKEMVVAAEKWPGLSRNRWQDSKRTFPEVFFIHRQWPWMFKKTVRLILLPVVLGRLISLSRRTNIRQILAIFPCEYYLFLSWLVARWLQVPLVSYFHNTYLENRRGLKHWFANWLQPRVFRDSQVVFVMSEGMREVLSAKHPQIEFVPLVHTFEDRSAPLEVPPTPRWPLNVAFMGSVNDSNRDALSRLSVLMKRYPETMVTTYSGNPPEDFTRLGIAGPRVQHTSVAFNEVVSALRKHDVLFFPHGFQGGLSEIEYRTIFPTRTTPYLLSGVPIVAHTPRGAFLTRWLRKHDCAEVVDDPDKEALIAAFERLAGNPERCRVLSTNAQKAAEEFFAPRVADLLRRRLNLIE
ncbi:MAG: glycosyltransferase [Planctomycetota bacterium]|jgi:glycosyltransferase involved in cell wall biosynthesis